MKKVRNFFSSPLGIVLTCVLVISFPYYLTNITSVNHSREGCERLNTNREVQLQYLEGDLDNRQQILVEDMKSLELLTAPDSQQQIQEKYGITLDKDTIAQSIATTNARIKANTKFTVNDEESIRRLRTSTTIYADSPGSVSVDCAKAYPKPFPF